MSTIGAIMVLGSVVPGAMRTGLLPETSSTALGSSGTAASSIPLATATQPEASTPAAPSSSFATASPDANGPHPGTLVVHKDASGGSPSVDPSVCYYTVCYEPIMNVYQTLVAYNGSSSATFVPEAATCVPGTVQCTSDYGTNPTGTADVKGFTGMFNAAGGITNGVSNGTPVFWTFVIDPAAHFYDAGNTTGWPVYPTDVAFSIARTVGYSDLPFVARTPGWIVAQSLLPAGNASFDVYGTGSSATPDHNPYNNTPYWTMSSMLINNSTYCPASAMTTMGNGCITFVANGSGQPWAEFLQFIADNLGASIQSCGWFTANGAGVPGFNGTAHAHGDGPCTLWGGGFSTDSSSYKKWLATVAPGTGKQTAGTGMYSWDAWQNESYKYPADVPGVQGVEIGSGPYWSSVSLTSSYGLRANPSYRQPSGCGGNPAYAQYVGYCDPAPNHYIGNVTVYWDTSDGPGVAGYQSGTVDLADISPNHISELLSLAAAGKIYYEQLPAINVFQQSYVTEWNSSERTGYGFSGTENIPQDFFSYEAARSLLQMSYPFENIEHNVWTSDGIETLDEVGSQLAQGLGCYAPPSTTNGCSNPYSVKFPYLVNGGEVDSDASVVGSAGWWWAQGRNVSSPYYDPELVACTSSNPCQFSIEGGTGAPSQDAANDLWATSIESITGGAVRPNTPDISESDLLTDCGLASPGQSACPIYNFGWIADYPDPTDYEGAYGLPSSSYGGPDDLGSLIAPGVTHDNNTVTCNADLPGASAHLTYSVANLAWWANALNSTPLPEACQGPAYNIYVDSLEVAAALVGGTSINNPRVLIYDLGATIENALNFYTWTGQQYPIYTAAPWINLSSINTNVVIGAGDCQFWFMIHYRDLFSATVSETGLPGGTKWTASLGNSTASSSSGSISFANQPNGTYTFTVSSVPGYTVTPSNGTFTVSGATTKSVAYTPLPSGTKTTNVYFNETGLVTGVAWTVIIPGYGAETSTSASLAFVLPQGRTYDYAPQSVVGYTPVAAGTVTVGAAPVSTALLFHGFFGPVYTIYFNETGLGSGVSWGTTVNTSFAGAPTSLTTVTAVTSAILVYEQNGTTNWTITVPSGYALAPTTGFVIVNGSEQSVSVYFIKLPSTSIAWTYLSTLAYALIGLLAVLMLVGFVLAARYRRSGRPAKAPETWTAEEQSPSSSGGGDASPPSGQGGPPTK